MIRDLSLSWGTTHEKSLVIFSPTPILPAALPVCVHQGRSGCAVLWNINHIRALGQVSRWWQHCQTIICQICWKDTVILIYVLSLFNDKTFSDGSKWLAERLQGLTLDLDPFLEWQSLLVSPFFLACLLIILSNKCETMPPKKSNTHPSILFFFFT